MIFNVEDVLRLLLAMLIGGLIGTERELRDKSAGLRTLMFICTGAALFTIFSQRLGTAFGSDPNRITAQIVSGVGFLGAGAILREGLEIRGLTTAATIWLVAALGVGVGSGMYLFSILAALAILIALWVFPHIEGSMSRTSQSRTYRLVFPIDMTKHQELSEIFNQHHLRVINTRRMRQGDRMICTWMVAGRPAAHDSVIDALLLDPDVVEFEY